MKQGTSGSDQLPACPASVSAPGSAPALLAPVDRPPLRGNDHPQILTGQWMPLHAVRLAVRRLMRCRAQRHQMLRPPAPLVPALMMHMVTRRRLAHEMPVRSQMHRDHLIPDPDPRVTVATLTHPPGQRTPGLPALTNHHRPEPQALLQPSPHQTLTHTRRTGTPHPRIVQTAQPAGQQHPDTPLNRTPHIGEYAVPTRHSTRVIYERESKPWA